MHYYGSKGRYKWYRKTEFIRQMEKIFTSETPIIKHALFGHSPLTDKVSAFQFRELLQMTHQAIHNHLSRNKIEHRLKPYAGPQCNEDRGKENLLHYDVDFRIKIRMVEESAELATASVPEILSQPSSIHTQGVITQPIQPQDKHFSTCNFRVCSRCKKTRLIDERASKCFPLGTYKYANKTIRPKFQCDMLVDITCRTKEDIE